MNDTSYQIDIRCQPGYLYVQAWGIRSGRNLTSIVKDYLKANEEHGYKKILADIRSMTGKLTGFDASSFGNAALEGIENIDSEGKTAIVDLEENRKRFSFLEDASFNPGLNVRFFSKTADAQRWLRKGKFQNKGEQ